MQNLKNSQQSVLIQHTLMLFGSIQISFIFIICAIMLGKFPGNRGLIFLPFSFSNQSRRFV